MTTVDRSDWTQDQWDAWYKERYAGLVFESGTQEELLKSDTGDIELVDRAANRHPDGVIYVVSRPGRHHDLIHHMGQLGRAGAGNVNDQGFLTTHGRFINRVEARIIADREGQTLPDAHSTKYLFSEDLFR
jgi:hypothetical protein